MEETHIDPGTKRSLSFFTIPASSVCYVEWKDDSVPLLEESNTWACLRDDLGRTSAEVLYTTQGETDPHVLMAEDQT